MNTTQLERKQKAIELMKELKIYKPYIDGFIKENAVCYYENFAGFWAWQDEELEKKIKEIETQNKMIFKIRFTLKNCCENLLHHFM